MTALDSLEGKKYILLETYKKSGKAVPTPVWFVIDEGLVYVVTRERTGKIKRLKNNKSVRIAPCSFSGKTKGPWFLGTAEFALPQKTQVATTLRAKKYGILDKIAKFASRGKGSLVVFSIKLE